MASIDERVVAMSFENAKFETGVATTMGTLTKLNDAIAKTGTGPNGLENIEKSASKVNLEAPMSALDRLKAKLGRTNSGSTFTDMENASNKVTLEQPTKALDNLKNKLDHTNAGTTFTDMENAGNRINFSGLTTALDGVKTHLSGIETAAAVAFGNIVSKASLAGGSFAKSFTFGPIKAGFDEYKTNLQAIQTIQANTDQPLPKVNKALQELNTYSDQTIYNFGEMARNIGTFTAAGVDLKNATSSIKGIANIAALSGSNSQQASTAMYQLSQAIASGKVGLQDWNSVVNAGMGGKKLQGALATTAIAMGGIDKSSVKLEGPLKKLTISGKSFRESIQSKPGSKPWLTSEVLVNTLASLDGRFSKAALGAQLTSTGLKKYTSAQIEAKVADSKAAMEKKNGVKYTDAQFKALQKLSDSAFKSATEVKTLGQVFSVAKETIGSGWSASFVNIFGNLAEAKKTFTALSGAINGMINASALARNKVLSDWKKLGGRTAAIEGIKQAFQNVMKVLGAVKDAFREVFPAKTGKDLFEMSKGFHDLMTALEPSKATLENLKRTLAGVFAVAHIGWTIIKSVGKVILDLIGIAGKGGGGFLNFTGGIGDFLVALDKAISKGGALKGFFGSLTNVLRVPIELIRAAAKAIFGLFGGFDSSKLSGAKDELSKVGKVLTPMERIVNGVKDAWHRFVGVLGKFKEMVSPFFEDIRKKFASFGEVIANAFNSADFSKVLSAFQTVFLGGILVTIKKAFGGKGIDLTGGALSKIGDTFGALTGQLTAMQKNVQAKTIATIAAAILLLAGGVYILSTIPAKKLASAMTAVAVGLGEMAGALKIFGGGMTLTGIAALPVMAASMIIMAGALVILALAMKIFATMNWEEIGKGLAGVGGVLTTIGIAVKFINPVAFIPIAAGMVLMAGAMVMLAIAVKMFSEMSWADLAKGLVGLAGALAILTVAMVALGIGLSVSGPLMLLVGPSIIAISIGLTILAGAVSAFGAMDLPTLAKGLIGMVAALAIMTAAMIVMGIAFTVLGPSLILAGPALIIAAVGMGILAGAIGIMGKLKVTTLVKGIFAMAAALAVLSVGLYLMIGTLPGSLALLAAAAAFVVLGPALAFMGNLNWSTIIKGLAAMALTMGVIAVVGLVAAPALLAMGAALAVLGLALIEIGAAVYLVAKGLALLGENGAKGVGVLIAAVTAFVALLPTLVIDFVKGLLVIAEELAKIAPKVLLALGVMIDMVIAFIIESAPKLAVAANTLITAILNVLGNNAGPMIAAGWKLIQQLIGGLVSNLPAIIRAGANMIIKFLSGIAVALPAILSRAAQVVSMFLDGITAHLPSVIAKGVTLIVTFINGVSQNIGRIISAGASLLGNFMVGIGNAIPTLVKKGLYVARRFLNGLADGMSGLADAGFKAIIRFLNGIENAIRNNSDDLFNAGAGIFDAIMDGIVEQAGKVGPILKRVMDKAIGILPHWARKILGIHSPSTVFQEIGKLTMAGMAVGITDGTKNVNSTMLQAAKGVVSTAKGTLNQVPNILDDLVDLDPVIAPVLDLSSVKQEAKKLDGLTNVTPITAAVSYGHATAISEEKKNSEIAQAAQAVQAGTTINFEQHNTSPESLSDVEVYRQTKNLLSTAKDATGIR